MRRQPDVVVILARITHDKALEIAPGQETAIQQLEGEDIYILGPTRGVEVLEALKNEHFKLLHLNPTWDGDWPGWLEDPRDGSDGI